VLEEVKKLVVVACRVRYNGRRFKVEFDRDVENSWRQDGIISFAKLLPKKDKSVIIETEFNDVRR